MSRRRFKHLNETQKALIKEHFGTTVAYKPGGNGKSKGLMKIAELASLVGATPYTVGEYAHSLGLYRRPSYKYKSKDALKAAQQKRVQSKKEIPTTDETPAVETYTIMVLDSKSHLKIAESGQTAMQLVLKVIKLLEPSA